MGLGAASFLPILRLESIYQNQEMPQDPSNKFQYFSLSQWNLISEVSNRKKLEYSPASIILPRSPRGQLPLCALFLPFCLSDCPEACVRPSCRPETIKDRQAGLRATLFTLTSFDLNWHCIILSLPHSNWQGL